MDEWTLQIVILPRGWVWMGWVRCDLLWLHMLGGYNVRKWGTTKGLGQLAAEGPTPKSKLDPVAEFRAPVGAVLGLIACNLKAWRVHVCKRPEQ